MSATLRIFQVDGKRFRHVMNTDRDRVELHDEDDRTLLSYRNGTTVFRQEERLGSLSIDFGDGAPHWIYHALGEESSMTLGPDIDSAKIAISRHFIRTMGLASTDNRKQAARQS